MTKPSFLSHISNGEQLENSNLPFLVPNIGFFMSLDIERYPNIKTKCIIANAAEVKPILDKTVKVTIAVDHLNLGYGYGEYEDAINISTLEKFTVLKEDLTFDFCCYVLHKNSVISPKLDDFLVKVRESGLEYYYLAESFRDLDYKEQVYLRTIQQLQGQATYYFNINTLSGAFLMLFCGLLLATVIFFCELSNSSIPWL
ncbi:uncharacterized protein Ir47a [Atheta coriaria]|uniref:uncharacterized protein Ir47a n=1 Tax=Dalotia coriaria TaxID=877792 RepID=UPI0031F3F133